MNTDTYHSVGKAHIIINQKILLMYLQIYDVFITSDFVYFCAANSTQIYRMFFKLHLDIHAYKLIYLRSYIYNMQIPWT